MRLSMKEVLELSKPTNTVDGGCHGSLETNNFNDNKRKYEAPSEVESKIQRTVKQVQDAFFIQKSFERRL